MENDISTILSQFPFEGKLIEIQPINEGLINTTLVADFGEKKYVIQKINTNVFKNPDNLMDNIVSVTEYLKKSIEAEGGNADRQTLRFLKTVDGKPFYIDEDGECWRSYVYLDNSYTISSGCSLDEIYEAARAFGKFQYLLGDFPGNELFETIPNFHHTPTRYDNLMKAVEENKAGRLDEVQEEINFFKDRKHNTSVVTSLLKSGELPVRVTHNDTKINNVLFDGDTKKAICVIDLDTIMPGSSLYDFGDGIRTSATFGEEDDEENIGLNVEAFEAYVKGFLDGTDGKLFPKEIELLPFSVILLTQEVAMRFLTDYLDGDVYFKTSFDKHNLVRTRAQIKLIKDVESKMPQLIEITKAACRRS
ncbi:MAG: aminoglycoside phosphotransferase family protein [Clostridia bacterium]|nr:aminoglycoside phosphotransferase family protein [Clostridia bacterium]